MPCRGIRSPNALPPGCPVCATGMTRSSPSTARPRGALVTIDAMGCQHGIAGAILEAGADHLPALKPTGNPCMTRCGCSSIRPPGWSASRPPMPTRAAGNPPRMGQPRGRLAASRPGRAGRAPLPRARHPRHGRGPGRREGPDRERAALEHVASNRTCFARGAQAARACARPGDRPPFLGAAPKPIKHDMRHFLSSAPITARQLLHATRAHWGIENRLHRVMNIVFHDDLMRLRTGNGPANMAVIRHAALNIFKQIGDRASMKVRRKTAAWGDNCLFAAITKTI